MLSDFSTISPVWIRYCITEINMESIERNGLYDPVFEPGIEKGETHVSPS